MSERAPPRTIAAIATPPGRGGIGIVRVSGTGLAEWGPPLIGRALAPRRPLHASFLDREGRALDDGIALFFPRPGSFTGEDVLELQAHGGPVVLRMLLARCLELGARLAEPGEFTRRAFLNDKLDLAQAEAVADVIEATTESAVRSAVRSLRGEFSVVVHALVEQLIELRMLVEATLDFPEEEIDALDRREVMARHERLLTMLADATRRGRQGAILRSGLRVVLAGQPNVGKSSLLNRLAGDEVAIVTPIAGTTRDAIREAIQIDGVPIHVVDTAGLRESTDEVERIGIDRTWTEIGRSDVLVLLVDARHGVTGADEAIAARVPPALARIVVHNKIDLCDQPAGRLAPPPRGTIDGVHIRLSALTGDGMETLQGVLLEAAGWQPGGEDVFMARERHLRALERATERVVAAATVFDRSELFAEELRGAQTALGEITGEFTAEDLLGEIFSRFCIGK